MREFLLAQENLRHEQVVWAINHFWWAYTGLFIIIVGLVLVFIGMIVRGK